ncbi:acyltransferase family protein [Sphingomonas sp.]
MDAMRAVLAVTVAFGHLWGLLVEDYRPTASVLVNSGYFLAGFAHSAVILFFVLSGYWIARSVSARAERGWRWDDYLIDRVARLGIVLVPALMLGGMLDWIGYHLLELPTHYGLTGAWVFTQDLSQSLTLRALVGNLLFLQHLIVPPFGSNGPLWSLAFEFWYYLWFPALWLALRYRRPCIALATLGIAFANPEIALGFLSWLCGAALLGAERRWPDLRLPRWTPVPAGLLCLAALLWGRTGDFGVEDPIEAASFALFLFTLLRSDPPRIAALRPLASFGAQASFSLYAIHFPLIALAAGWIVGDARLAPGGEAVLAVVAILILALAAAWLFAARTEAHTGALRNWIRRRVQGGRAGDPPPR